MTGSIEYAPLKLETLSVELPLGWDLFIEEGGRYVLYKEASLPFTRGDRDRLLASGVLGLWIRISVEDDPPSPQQLGALLALPDEEISPATKAGLLYASAVSTTRQTMTLSVSTEQLHAASELVRTSIEYFARSRSAFGALLSVMVHDSSVYTHSANVALYAVGLGRSTGIDDLRVLQDLGLGAFLHDVGKIRVPARILDKPGPLSAEEWSIMRQHPTWGVEMLHEAVDLPWPVLAVVSQHHERLDGSGYPRALVGDSLHQFSKIVSIADAFDALTSHRPYRGALDPYQALLLIRADVGTKLDSKLFAGMVHLLGGGESTLNGWP